jgi:methionine synthase II (cobalamin-independent)
MTSTTFQPNCLPLLIGSLPVTDHQEAQRLILEYTPEIPLWPQLPVFKEEGMMAQFLPGMPGLEITDQKTFIDTETGRFDEELLGFYEEYMAVLETAIPLADSRFVLTPDTAKGFFTFLETLKSTGTDPVALKGQITGPITLCTGVNDSQGRAIYYNDQVRDAAVKLIALKARFQVQAMKAMGKPAIVFLDEPGLTGFGSSAFISMTKEDVLACFGEVIDAIHEEGGLAGIHVCANADWSLVLESPADVASFDAYAYFDRFILYPELIKDFMAAGKILAWGIVPTLNPEDIDKETAESLTASWLEKVAQVEALGIAPEVIRAQSLITPACGTGSLDLAHAMRVLSLTREVSDAVRKG